MSTAFLAKWNEEVIDRYYEQWRHNPRSVSEEWAVFFEGFELGFERYKKREIPVASSLPSLDLSADGRVENLINAYRTLGHSMAKLDPLNAHPRGESPLEISAFGFEKQDLETIVSSPSFRDGEKMTLESLIQVLRAIYCGTSSVEFMHIQDASIRNWVRDVLEKKEITIPETSHYRILRTLHKAELFENFLHTTYE
jgi:2-oxoglutarate dehydrogenase E1 component